MVYLNRHVNCMDPKCSLKSDPLHPKVLPKTQEAVRNFMCGRCVLTCCICGTKDVAAFSKSYKKHKVDVAYNIRCNECSHPACTNPDCRTCQSCGDIKCEMLSCAKTPVPLNPKWRPKTLEEVENFKCAHCREQAFHIYNCLSCHQKKFTNAFDAVAIKAHVKNCNKNKLLCLECLEQGRTIRDIKLYSCHPCNRELGRAKFCAVDMNKFQQGRLRVLRCTECKLSGTMST